MPVEDIETLTISAEDARDLALHLARVPFHPYIELDRFIAEVTTVTCAFAPKLLLEGLSRFAAVGNDDGGLMIRGLPAMCDLPPTPSQSGVRASTSTWMSEALVCAVASILGEPIAYAEERRGHVFHDVFPTNSNASELSSESSAAELDFHTELAFHPHPPDHLILHGLRQDPGAKARTLVSGTRRFLQLLDAETKEVLFQPEFSLRISKLHSPYRAFGRPVREHDPVGPLVPILSGQWEDPSLRFEPELMSARTDRAGVALRELKHAVRGCSRAVVIEPGSILVMDNRQCAHARSPFEARFDGTDRWLRRTMVARSLTASVADRAPGSRVISTDLGAGWATP